MQTKSNFYMNTNPSNIPANTSPTLDQEKNGLDVSEIAEVLEDKRTVLGALEYLPRSECKSMHDAAKMILIDRLVSKLRMATKDADALKSFDEVAAKRTVESLPGLDNAVRALEVKMEKKIREGVVPAVSETMRMQIRNVVPDIATSPLAFWMVSTWMNENVRPSVGIWLAVIFGDILATGIYKSISEGTFETKMKELASKGLPRFGLHSWIEMNWFTGKLWEDAAEILKKIPSDLAQELERTAKKVINTRRLRTLAVTLSLTTPFAYDRMVTEPAEEQYMQTMIHGPIKAIQEMEEKMKAPNVTANIVKKLLEKNEDNVPMERKNMGDRVRRIDVETNFFMPGNSGNEEETNTTMARDWSKQFVRIDEIGGWIDRSGEEIILPIADKSMPSLNLSGGDMEKFFGKVKPEFGVRICNDNSSVETVAIVRSGKYITTITIRPKRTMRHEDEFVGDMDSALSRSGDIGKLSSAFESLAQEMRKQKEEISKLEHIKLSPSAPTHPIKIDKKNKKRKK